MSKRLAAMRANPRADWTMADVEAVCAEFGIRCRQGRGSHVRIDYAGQDTKLTIPAKRPIKAPYIRALVRFIDQIASAS